MTCCFNFVALCIIVSPSTVQGNNNTTEKLDWWEQNGYNRKGINLTRLDLATRLCGITPQPQYDDRELDCSQSDKDSNDKNRPRFEIIYPIGKFPNCLALFKCHFGDVEDVTIRNIMFVNTWKSRDIGRDVRFDEIVSVVPVDLRGNQLVTIDKVNKVAVTREFHTHLDMMGCYQCVVNGSRSNSNYLDVPYKHDRALPICPMRRMSENDIPQFKIHHTKDCCAFFICSAYCTGNGTDCDPSDVEFNLKVPADRSLYPFPEEWFREFTLYTDTSTDSQRDLTRVTKVVGLTLFHYMRTDWACTFHGAESDLQLPQVPRHCPWFPPPPPPQAEVRGPRRYEQLHPGTDFVPLLVVMATFTLVYIVVSVVWAKTHKKQD